MSEPEIEAKMISSYLDEVDQLRAIVPALKSEVERLKVELERAKSDRNAEGMRVRGELLPKLQAMADELEKQGHLSWVKLEIVKGELKEAQAAAPVMRSALEKVIREDSLFQIKAWCQKALSTTSGTDFLERMAEAEWLVEHADACDFVEFGEQEAWLKRQHTFLKGEGVKA